VWDDPASLRHLMRLCAPLVIREGAALQLWRTDDDPPAQQCIAALTRAYNGRFPANRSLRADLLGRGAEEHVPADALVLHARREPPEFLGQRTALTDVSAVERVLDERWPLSPPSVVCGAPPTEAVQLSVIIPTHDRPDCLRGCLTALAGQTLSAEAFEVIVIDDGSTPPVALEPSDWPFGLRLLRQDGAGPARARNVAMRLAEAETVVFFDDDAVPGSGCLAAHLAAQQAADRPTGVVGTFALLPHLRTDAFTELVERSTILFAQPELSPDAPCAASALCTGNLSLPRAVIEAVGGFDERMTWAGGEDSELGTRLARFEGVAVRYVPACDSGHDHALTVHDFAARQRKLGWSALYIALRRGDPGYVVGPGNTPPGDRFWEALRLELQQMGDEQERLIAQIEEVCASADPVSGSEEIRPLVHRVGYISFIRGLLDARAELMIGAGWRAW